jgi:hypothetical protein
MEGKQLLVRGAPSEPTTAVRDVAVHRDTHRVDQQRLELLAPEQRIKVQPEVTLELERKSGYRARR